MFATDAGGDDGFVTTVYRNEIQRMDPVVLRSMAYGNI
jgi:hypothetical protein